MEVLQQARHKLMIEASFDELFGLTLSELV
jgi:hypothetical protein